MKARVWVGPWTAWVIVTPFSGLAAQVEPPAADIIATETVLAFPIGLAMDARGLLYVSERRAHRVIRIDLESGVVTMVAGTGVRGFSGDGGLATEAQIACPDAIDFDASGNLYIADRCNERIRRINARTGIIETLAGTGERGPGPDGPALQVALTGVYYLNAGSEGELIFTDTDSHRIRRLDLDTGLISTLAGTGEQGFGGDGGPATEAQFYRPHVATRLRNGDVVIGDTFNDRIRLIDHRTGTIRTIAGRGSRGAAAHGSPALEAEFAYFGEILEEANGNLLITEWGNGRLLRLHRDSATISVLAGSNDPSTPGADGNLPTETRLGGLVDFVVDTEGRVLVAAAEAGLVRRIDLRRGVVETVAGRPDGS